MALYFYPRGGSAHVTRALARQLANQGLDVDLLAGSRTDLGTLADGERFFDGLDPHIVDFTPALQSADPQGFEGPPGTAPMHGSYEDRPNCEDPIFASLGQTTFDRHVDAWAVALDQAGAGEADLLYLHHLTPINEAAAREFPDVPICGHIHGSELLMIERIASGAPVGWRHAEIWLERFSRWAASCERLVVNSPEGRKRAVRLLDLDPERMLLIANGIDPEFAPRRVDRRAHWKRHLVDRPRGWRAGERPGSVSYTEAEIEPLGGTTLLAAGRFTEVKRLTLLIEAYAEAAPRFDDRTALVLLGGYPGEWEGEHPAATIERLGLTDVYLAGWHSRELPDFFSAADVVVHASVHEQFGQVLIEAMGCGVPVVAVDRGGPATIIADGDTGWLIEPDDRAQLIEAIVDAVNDPAERRARGLRAREEVTEQYAWSRIGAELATELWVLVDALNRRSLPSSRPVSVA
jgi:glycosyltransferase involved in cell wall biosynthesis